MAARAFLQSRQELTAQVLSLRRLAEFEAHEAMRAVRAQLEFARQTLEKARQALAEAEQQFLRAQTAEKHEPIGPLPALQFAQQAEARRAKASEVRQRRVTAEQAAALVGAQAALLEQHRASWLACVARREAAELYASLERREQRRARAARERAHDDEARQRFALTRPK